MMERWARGILAASVLTAGCEAWRQPGPALIIQPTATPGLQRAEAASEIPFLLEREVPLGTVRVFLPLGKKTPGMGILTLFVKERKMPGITPDIGVIYIDNFAIAVVINPPDREGNISILGHLRELKPMGRETDFETVLNKMKNPDDTHLMIVQWEEWQFKMASWDREELKLERQRPQGPRSKTSPV